MKLKAIAGIAAVLMSSAVYADTLALWTFETSVPTTAGPHAAEGTGGQVFGGNATGFHADGATVYSNPVGNGSNESFSSNTWGVGDYYQFQTASTGYEDISIAWDQTRSGTGPASFNLQYSTDGTTFTTFGAYAVGTLSWSSGSAASSGFAVDLSSITALDNDASIYIRMTSATDPVDGGTSRIDNVRISGNEVAAVGVPLPIAALGGLGLMSLIGVARRTRAAV